MGVRTVSQRMSRRQAARLGAAGAVAAATSRFAAPAVIRAQEPVTLTFFYPVGVAGPLAQVMQAMVDEFNAAHPEIKVEASFTGSCADTATKVQTAVQGDNAPDVAVLLATDKQTMLDLGALFPVSDLETAEGFDPKDFREAYWADTQVDGKTWCVPFQRSTPVLYYNKTAFEQAGLDPETWDDLVAFGSEIMKAEAATWGVDIPATTSAYWLFQALAIQSGQTLNGEDAAHVNFDTPEAIEALTWMVGLSTEAKVMPTGAIDWAAGPTDFSSSTTGFLYHSTGSLVSIKSQAEFEFGTAFLPKNTDFGVPTGGGNVYVFKTDDDLHPRRVAGDRPGGRERRPARRRGQRPADARHPAAARGRRMRGLVSVPPTSDSRQQHTLMSIRARSTPGPAGASLEMPALPGGKKRSLAPAAIARPRRDGPTGMPPCGRPGGDKPLPYDD